VIGQSSFRHPMSVVRVQSRVTASSLHWLVTGV
jgi:hypothetical protein